MKPAGLILSVLLALSAGCANTDKNFIRVSDDNKGFVFAESGKRFIPWGHNYTVNDPTNNVEINWSRTARDFDDFRNMRANVARIHLHVPHFMIGPNQPNPKALAELSRLLKLAEKKGVYLDVTGLASYNIHKRAAWYDSLPEKDRWAAQACFWEAIAETCAKSRAVFCYDLMNEPVIGGNPKDGWYAGRMGDYEFVQRLSFNSDGRSQAEIGRAWTELMVAAIRKHDRLHPITIGMLPAWGPSPKAVGADLDFIAVHIYPLGGHVADAISNLKQFDIGKPIVVEETFPLSCGVEDERDFLLQSRGIASGWIGQYPAEGYNDLLALKRAGKITLGQSLYLAWIELFREVGPKMLEQ